MARRLNFLLILPPLVFLLFAAAAYVGLRRENPDELPSALVGQQAPALAGTVALRADPAPTDADLRAPGQAGELLGELVQAVPGRASDLAELAEEGITVIGVNYKDDPEALGFLAQLGDPYAKVGADTTGRTGPRLEDLRRAESFVVAADGTVLMRHPGPLTEDAVAKRLMPAIEIRPLSGPATRIGDPIRATEGTATMLASPPSASTMATSSSTSAASPPAASSSDTARRPRCRSWCSGSARLARRARPRARRDLRRPEHRRDLHRRDPRRAPASRSARCAPART